MVENSVMLGWRDERLRVSLGRHDGIMSVKNPDHHPGMLKLLLVFFDIMVGESGLARGGTGQHLILGIVSH